MVNNLDTFYVGGRWITPGSAIKMGVVNPATEEDIGEIYLATREDVEHAVAAARDAFGAYAQTSRDQRIKWLTNLLDSLEEQKEEMAQAISKEMGAPIRLSRNAQVESGIGHTRHFIDALQLQLNRETLDNGDDIQREPIGVCGLITPWNWPINQIALKVIPALAAGCTCVLKPSEYTPLSATLFAELVDQAGFPPGVFNMVHGEGGTAGSALSKSTNVDMVSFTGSTRAGRAVTRDAAETVKRVTLELGGKSPNIVFSDCDLAERVQASTRRCFENSGQSCNAPTRMLVERSCLDEVLEIAESVGNSHQCGDPMKEGWHLGPLANEIQFERVQHLIKKGIEQNARLICGGAGKPEGFEAGYFVKPTIFYCENAQADIVQEEIFGPVLTIMGFDTEAEAIAMANDSPYGLAAYIQTSDEQKAERVAAQLRVGAVHINGAPHQYGSPFGGYKQSGNGREGGVFGLEEFQEIKTLHYARVA